MDRQSFWWTYVSGAARYLQDFVSECDGHRVVVAPEVPFMDTFLQLLRERLMQRDSSLQVEVGAADEWAADRDIGEWLLERYALQADYHPMDGTRAEFLGKKEVLAGRVLIVRRINLRAEWCEFAVQYARSCFGSGGLLVLTFEGANPLAQRRRGVATPGWESYITSYDLSLFASYCMADQAGVTPTLRNYVTQIAARLSGCDPELCGRLSVPELAEDPITLLRKAGGEITAAATLAGDEALVESVIWEAQIQIVFPIIEQRRRQFIEAYTRELQQVLPQVDEFGKQLEEPRDMELRHLWYYYFRTTGFQSVTEAQTFRTLYDARNELAHLEPLDFETVTRVFELANR